MRAAVMTGYGAPLDVREIPDPDPADHGAVVELEACGICRSDWHGWRGDYPQMDLIGQVLGHEPAGRVTAVGERVEAVAVGDRVTVPFNLADGTCGRCRKGQTNHCENAHSLGFHASVPGAFAEAMHVPWADVNAIRLPENVSPVEMAGLGCRFMTSFHALAHRANVTPGDWVAVHGCGGIGLSAVDIATALGASVIAVDIQEEKLALARELGARAVVNATEESDVPSAVRSLTDGGADVSVDALGIAETCRQSVDSLDDFGQHLQIGLTTQEEAGEVALPTDVIVRKELSVIGSYGMPPTRYDELLAMVERDRVHPEAVVTREVALEDVTERLRAMTDYETRGIEVITEF